MISQQGTTAGGQQEPPTPLTPSPSSLDAYSPEGGQEVCDLSAGWEPNPDHNRIYGNNPDMTPEQKQRLRGVLLQNQGAFA
jgi:hypothetical protein